MADFEVSLACTMIAGKRYRIVPVGLRMAPVSTFSGLVVSPTATLNEALSWDDLDGLIIPGGSPNPQPPELTALIRRLDDQGKLLAAICAGPTYLARAGVLDGRKFTHTADAAFLAKLNSPDPFPTCGFTSGGVVRDRNVITAPDTSFVDFAAEIMDFLGLFGDDGDKTAWATAYKGLA
jgi:putative intracellular protease/amidase